MSQNSKKTFFKTTLFKHGNTTRPVTFHAYDLETSNIPQHDTDGNFPKENITPKPLYITAYSEHDVGFDRAGEPVKDSWQVSKPLNSLNDLKDILIQDFLTDDKIGHRFVAWNGNNFDAYFIGLSLLDTDFVIRPYITKSNAIRGLKIIDPDNYERSWEFLDGLAMTGITTSLKKFVLSFAPDFEKMSIDFASGVQFDSKNKDHVKYALRDSVSLYHAMLKCDEVVFKLTEGMHLTPTVGNLGIKFFQKMMPEKVYVRKPNDTAKDAINYSLKRGGYCYLNRRFSGPVWKYDINQAYAAAMRECSLPSGHMTAGMGKASPGEVGMYRITASTSKKLPPFYWKHADTAKAYYSNDITDAWVTTDEFLQLEKEGFKIEVQAAYYWDETFNMEELVNHLETLRLSDPEGPNGPLGTMCKSLGNNAYGKTAEQLGGEELLMSKDCPPGFKQWEEGLNFIWARTQDKEEIERGYHQPQLASFITAYVRMVVRRAILKNYNGWIYADTDCVVFDSPCDLDIDKKRYGAWKQETDGEEYRFIVKKGYYSLDKKTVHCKGMNIRSKDGELKFSDKDLKDWWKGKPPKQRQTQRKNFLSVMTGSNMYHGRTKTAQKIIKK